MDLVIYKGNRFYEKGFFDIKVYQKEQNLYAYIPQKSNHRRHTIKNYVLNELKRYIKYNSEKLNFLKLRNKFFDRLRNRGFRKYTLSKLFSAVKYSSRNKLLATNDTIYSTVVQETQADMALIEIAEEIFSRRLNEEPTIMEESRLVVSGNTTISPKDKVVTFSKTNGPRSKQEKSKIDYSLGLVLPGECQELKKDIQSIFVEEKEKCCSLSTTFKACFNDMKIAALFKNEKKLGALISKTKL